MAGDTSIIKFIGSPYKHVRKTLKPNKQKYKNLVSKEVEALKKLHTTKISPKLVDFGDTWILMTYVGERTTRKNLPMNWREQVENILKILKKFNISHNDIQHEEILVMNNKLYLIDFQHWTSTRQEFNKLVEDNKTGCSWRLDDRESLFSHLESL